jgi:hypothetical protein
VLSQKKKKKKNILKENHVLLMRGLGFYKIGTLYKAELCGGNVPCNEKPGN